MEEIDAAKRKEKMEQEARVREEMRKEEQRKEQERREAFQREILENERKEREEREREILERLEKERKERERLENERMEREILEKERREKAGEGISDQKTDMPTISTIQYPGTSLITVYIYGSWDGYIHPKRMIYSTLCFIYDPFKDPDVSIHSGDKYSFFFQVYNHQTGKYDRILSPQYPSVDYDNSSRCNFAILSESPPPPPSLPAVQHPLPTSSSPPPLILTPPPSSSSAAQDTLPSSSSISTLSIVHPIPSGQPISSIYVAGGSWDDYKQKLKLTFNSTSQQYEIPLSTILSHSSTTNPTKIQFIFYIHRKKQKQTSPFFALFTDGTTNFIKLYTKRLYDSNPKTYGNYFRSIKYPNYPQASSVSVFGDWDNYSKPTSLTFSESENCFLLKADDIPGFTEIHGARFYFTVVSEEESLSPHYPSVDVAGCGKVNEINFTTPSIPSPKLRTLTYPKLEDISSISVCGSWDGYRTPIPMRFDRTQLFKLSVPQKLTPGQMYKYFFDITTDSYESSTFYPSHSLHTPYGDVGQQAQLFFSDKRCKEMNHYHRLRFFSSPDVVAVEVKGSWDNYHTPISLYKHQQSPYYLISSFDKNPPNIPPGVHTFIFHVTRRKTLYVNAPLQFTAYAYTIFKSYPIMFFVLKKTGLLLQAALKVHG